MKMDKEIRKKVIEAFKKDHESLNEEIADIISKMHKVKSVEKFMNLKKQLLLAYVSLATLKDYTCYFCLLHKMDCESCEYAKVHGACCDSDDAFYMRVCDAHDNLYSLLTKTYIDGEKYK
jgi:hypothetical protein